MLILILREPRRVEFELQIESRSTIQLDGIAYEKIIARATGPKESVREKILAQKQSFAAYAIHDTAKFQLKLAVFDTDSTFINQEVIDEIADFAGFKKEVAAITEQAMQGNLDFNEALAKRVALLKGLKAETLNAVKQTRLTLTPGARELMEVFHNRGVKTWLLSGGFNYFTSRFRTELGMTGDVANELEIIDGYLTGRTLGTIVNRERKAALLRELCAKHGADLTQTIAVGDGANDIDMAQASGLGIAFCAKPALVNATFAAVFDRDLRFIDHLLP